MAIDCVASLPFRAQSYPGSPPPLTSLFQPALQAIQARTCTDMVTTRLLRGIALPNESYIFAHTMLNQVDPDGLKKCAVYRGHEFECSRLSCRH